MSFEHHSSDIESTFDSLYFKYQFEHCNTIDDIINRLEDLKNYFIELKLNDTSLIQSVCDGWCYFNKDI